MAILKYQKIKELLGMGDYIANRQSWFTICPKCKNRNLKVTTWEEHLEGWGFDSYRVEEYVKCYCSVCQRSFDYDEVQEAEEKEAEAKARHIKRNTHQRQYKRTVKRGKKRKAKRERLRADRRNWDINKFLDDDIDDLPF